MSEFESYIPMGKPNKDTKFHVNTFGGGYKNPISSPDYTLTTEPTANKSIYNQPSTQDYAIKIKDASGNMAYNGHRMDYFYQLPNENYDKPPVMMHRNTTHFIKTDEWGGYLYDTSSLDVFIKDIKGSKDWFQSNKTKNLEEYKKMEKDIVFILADMQRSWSSEGNYNKSIIPSAGEVGNIQALRNATAQLRKDIPSDEQMFNQWNEGENSPKIICRDFSIATARIAKQLGFEAVAGTIEVGVSHAFTVLHSPDTGKYYGISADAVGGPAKIFEGSSLTQIRSTYQQHLISLGRAPHFGGVFLDDNGKVIGKWQNDLEKRRSKDFLGGNTPSRLLKQSSGTNITLNRGNIGAVDYTSLIAQKGIEIPGKTIDSEIFFRGGITQMGIGDSSVYALDGGIGGKLSTKPLEIREGLTARAYIAADLNVSVGYSDRQGTQVPYVSGNTIVGGQMKYTSGKWTFTTDLGKSYEISGPNQMQNPLVKLLPSGEYAIFAGEYKGSTADILGKAVFENYFHEQRRELSLGIRGTSGATKDLTGAIYARNTQSTLPGFPNENTREIGIGIGGQINDKIDWKVEAGKINGPMGSNNSVNAGISFKF